MKSPFEIKKEICEVGLKLWQKGFVAANDGNISVKISENEYYCTPTGVSKASLTPDMIIKVDRDGKKLEGKLNPSSEIKMHMRVYRERPDVNAVVHAHPPVATAFTVADIDLDQYVLPEAVLTIGAVPTCDYGTPLIARDNLYVVIRADLCHVRLDICVGGDVGFGVNHPISVVHKVTALAVGHKIRVKDKQNVGFGVPNVA